MSILNKLSNLSKATNTNTKTPMTDAQEKSCKEAIKAKNYGYCVHPNKFDISQPYRVAINYDNKWSNFGNFSSADVAAAVGTIVSAAYFGTKAKAGVFDVELVEADTTYQAWLADSRNADMIARANGDAPSVHGSATGNSSDVNPF